MALPIDIQQLRAAFDRGENITKILRSHAPRGSDANSLEAIEIAYDLQAGSYTRHALDNPISARTAVAEMYELCHAHLAPGDSILDCGTGELTTLSLLSQFLPKEINLLAFDISLSRIRAGQRFSDRAMSRDALMGLKVFVAEMDCIPLADNPVDVVITSHALEPNEGKEQTLLKELLRVARRRLILFVPSYENNIDEGRARMEDLGYVRGFHEYIEAAGGTLLSCKALKSIENPLNPTYCYSVKVCSEGELSLAEFVCPRSGHSLVRREGYWWSADGGWAYPVIDGDPCLRPQHGVLMTHG